MLVGGNGERRTLRLAATYADACNIIGETDVVERKVRALHAHCRCGRTRPPRRRGDPAVDDARGSQRDEVTSLLDHLRPRRTSAERYAASVNAGTVNDQIGRFRSLAASGVRTAIVSLPDLDTIDPIERFGPIIAAIN